MTPCEINGCRHVHTTCSDCGRLISVADRALQKEVWISVKDRLPDLAGFYLACDDYLGIVEKVEFNGKDKWDWSMSVTHWMPLPAAPNR